MIGKYSYPPPPCPPAAVAPGICPVSPLWAGGNAMPLPVNPAMPISKTNGMLVLLGFGAKDAEVQPPVMLMMCTQRVHEAVMRRNHKHSNPPPPAREQWERGTPLWVWWLGPSETDTAEAHRCNGRTLAPGTHLQGCWKAHEDLPKQQHLSFSSLSPKCISVRSFVFICLNWQLNSWNRSLGCRAFSFLKNLLFVRLQI